MRIRLILIALCISMSLSAQSDRDMLDAYRREDMSVWKTYIDTLPFRVEKGGGALLYEYGYCGYVVSADKEAATPFPSDITRCICRRYMCSNCAFMSLFTRLKQ